MFGDSGAGLLHSREQLGGSGPPCNCPQQAWLESCCPTRSHLMLSSTGGTHTLSAKAHQASVAEALQPRDAKQEFWPLLEDIDLVALHCVQVIIQGQQHQEGPKHGNGGQEVPDVMVIKEVKEDAVPVVFP